MARKMRRYACMSIGYMIVTCVFALVLGCAVACVDWWREARMLTPRLKAPATVKNATVTVTSEAKPVGRAAHRRAA